MSTIDSRAFLAAPANDPFPAFSSRRRRGVRVTTAAAVALGLALTGGGVAGAASSGSAATLPPPSAGQRQPGGSQPVAVGKVASVGTDSFTLTIKDDTVVTVTVSSSTIYQGRGTTSATLADVVVGKQVAVFGTDVSNKVTETRVSIGIPSRSSQKGAPGARGMGGSGATGAPGGMRGKGEAGGTPPGSSSAGSSGPS